MAQCAPPAFEEGSKCGVCACNFGTFKRRHHCRACGRSFCNEHSSSLKALPHFGLPTPVRVCKNCFEENHALPPPIPSKPAVVDGEEPASNFSKLNLDEGPVSPVNSVAQTVETPAFECKCDMPLCICATQEEAAPKPPPLVQPRPKKVSRPAAVSKATSSTQPVKTLPSLFFTSSQSTSQASGPYDTNEEGLREAIKNGDAEAVKELLSKGVDANYTDKQGMTLLHLAALFNLTDIAFMLVDAGANLRAKNAQGETALDCAQTTLRYKLEDLEKSGSLGN